MKTLTTNVILLWLTPIALLLAGCTTIYTPYGETYPVASTSYSIINNSGADLDVYLDGLPIAKGVKTGQVLPIQPPLWKRRMVAVVTGHKDGVYVGSDQWVFISESPDAWEVNRLSRPVDYQ